MSETAGMLARELEVLREEDRPGGKFDLAFEAFDAAARGAAEARRGLDAAAAAVRRSLKRFGEIVAELAQSLTLAMRRSDDPEPSPDNSPSPEF